MRQSQLHSRTIREISQEESSLNARLLTRAGYIRRLISGIYSYLPLGTFVLQKIENIIRDEMNRLGSQEVSLPIMLPKDIWEKTGRWESLDVLFKLKSARDRELALGATHEEAVTPLYAEFIRSFKDLPVSVYQIQTKFRDEPRAKSGLLRGREFRMKDMYSFHRDSEDLDRYYERVMEGYKRVYERCGIGNITYVTFALGGTFSKYSHEYQMVTEFGEDSIFITPDGKVAINREAVDDYLAETSLRKEDLIEKRAIEVGNIFKLGSRFSAAFDCNYVEKDGSEKPVIMGCYGIGSSRMMGAIVECHHDERGIRWPRSVAPFDAHLVSLARSDADREEAERLYARLSSAGISVLYDDRPDATAGEKFADSDLMGMPFRVVVSARTLKSGLFELKAREEGAGENVTFDTLMRRLAP